MVLQLFGISVSVLRAGAVNTSMLGASSDAHTVVDHQDDFAIKYYIGVTYEACT